MRNRIILIVWAAVLFFVAGPALSEVFHPDAATQYTRGGFTKTYTPRNYTPLPRSRNCPMCESIKEGWRNWERAKFGDTWDNIQNGRVSVQAKQDDSDEYEWVEVKETRTRKEKRCQVVGYTPFGRPIKQCFTVDVPYTEIVRKRVKKKAPEPVPESPPIELELTTVLPTPIGPVKRLFAHLRPERGLTIIDAGSGNGDVLIEASRSGLRAIGVEIDQANVKVSRERIRNSGFPAIVHQGDATTFDYSAADIVYIYQYPDLMQRIMQRIPRGCRVVSYQHPIPGIKSRQYEAGDGHVFYIGVVGQSEKRTPNAQTFGL